LKFQQTWALLIKRFIIFRRRYILAFIITVLPIFLTVNLCLIIAPSLIVDNVSSLKTLETTPLVLDINSYGKQDMTYFVSNPDPAYALNQLLYKMYNNKRLRPEIRLTRSNGSVLDFVFKKQNSSLLALVGNNFIGQEWIVPYDDDLNVNKFNITVYYSRMAFHSSAVAIHEVSNILLSFLNSNKFDKSIRTTNWPVPPSANEKTNYGDDFLKYLGCFDILPLSVFNAAVSILYAFVISLYVMHVAYEKMNESKKLQILSNTSVFIYWISNYIFDFFLCLLNVVSFVFTLKIVSAIREDPELDIFLLTSTPTFGYLCLILILSALSWPLLCYCWLHFFKSDVIAFIVLLIYLGIGAFLDVLLSFIQIFMHITDDSLEFESFGSLSLYTMRLTLAIICPNVTLKRILFNFRLKSSGYCTETLSRILKVKYDENVSYLSFSEPGISMFITILLFQFVFCAVLLTAIETESISRDLFKNLWIRFLNHRRVGSHYANQLVL
jgi:hypothetical protein